MLFVGTSGGQLLVESGTTFVEDTSIPVNTGVTRLREATTDTLWVGLRTASGAAVHTRVSAGAGTGTGTGTAGTPPPAGTKLDYVKNIKPLLGSCAGCHTSQSNYRLSAGLADDQADYQATLGVVDLQTPTASRILAKASNTMPHGGGGPWPTSSTAYQTVLAWIQQGAPMTGGTAPATPAVPTNPTYVTDIKPIMSTCVSCHAREDDFRLSANLSDDARDYRTVLGEVSLNTPARSGVVRHPTKQSEHPVKVFDVGSVPYDTLLRWIGNGAPFN
jgi:cytochrome c553